MKTVNPATGEISGELISDSPQAIASKVAQARRALRDWRRQSFQERKKVIKKFQDLIAEETDRLAKDLTLDMGKPISQARAEVTSTLPRIQFFLDHTESVLEEEEAFSEGILNEKITFAPLGVVANISAWNYPYFVGTNVIVPALLTGNVVCYKGSEFVPRTSANIERLMIKAGIPAGVFSSITGDGSCGANLLQQNIDAVFFTGSYATGVKINEVAAKKLIKVQLELGGKDPAYACEDTDPQSAASALADGAFYNCGQSCCAVERIYVHEKIYDAFMETFLSTVKGFKVGDPMDPNTYLGPLSRKEQLHVLEDQVADALKKGGKILLGGSRIDIPGFFFAPTVITNANHDMKLMRDESFGPIIGIMKVKSDEEALALMNDTSYGLTAAIYTKNDQRARDLLSEVESGTVYQNCCDRVSPHVPWTGWKHSGIGSTLSHHGIRNLLKPKAWHLKSSKPL